MWYLLWIKTSQTWKFRLPLIEEGFFTASKSMLQARPQTVQVNQANPMKKTHGETHYEDTTHAQPQLTVSRAPHRNTETGVRALVGCPVPWIFHNLFGDFWLQEVAPMPVLAASFEREGLIPTPVGLKCRMATPSRTTSRNIYRREAAVFKDRYKLPSRGTQHEVQKKRRRHRQRRSGSPSEAVATHIMLRLESFKTCFIYKNL